MTDQQNPLLRESERLWKNHRRGWIALLLTLSLATSLVDHAADLQLNLFAVPDQKPFDGTTYPIHDVPNWFTLNVDNDEITFNELKETLDPPLYDPSLFEIPYEDLVWGDPEDNRIRQMKLTYSVPYAGNYSTDSTEGKGSHPAVDWRGPEGTPVYAIANGVVHDVSYSTSGFGNHIVVGHKDVPSLENPSDLVTLYSGYAHLSTIMVTEGQVVDKGDQIGTIGQTGLASTHHLHFQIDREEAPYHMYWPFTSSEASTVGGFFNALNTGLNQENVYQYTVNPLEWIEAYSDYSVEFSSDEPAEPLETDALSLETIETSSEISEETLHQEPSPSVDDYVPPFSTIALGDHFAFMKPGDVQKVDISLLDGGGNILVNPTFYAPIQILGGDSDIARIFPNEFSAMNFVNGSTTLELTAVAEGQISLRFFFLGDTFETLNLVVSSEDPSLETILEFQENDLSTFPDVSTDHLYSRAIYALQKANIVQGNPDGTFRPDNSITRVESLKLILEGLGADLVTDIALSFPDTDATQWYSPYVATAARSKIVQGYPDGTFRPADPVNRIEFVKMLVLGMGVDADPVVLEDPFLDANKLEWYAPYAQFILEKNLSPWIDYLDPSNPMTRAEVAEMIYRVRVILERGETIYTES